MTTRRAVLFDIDGTLVDSNYVHVQAWRTAFREAGTPVPDWRVHHSLGMDGTLLLEALLPDADEAIRTAAKDVHTSEYAALAGELRRFDGVHALLREIRDRGALVVLSTSASPEELERLTDVLDCDDLVDAMTDAESVPTAKPEPDIVLAALDQVDVSPQNAVLVGDAVWDGIAAGRAGVGFVGVRSGGIDAAALRDAGASEVYDDISVLHGMLDASPIAALLDRTD